MKTFMNYLGQLRLYSLADLALLLFAIGTGTYQIIGAILLHVAFLAYLESRHAHAYRARVPAWLAYALGTAGLIFYGKIEGLLYTATSFLYTEKTKKLGGLSPFFRAAQNFFIIAGIVGYFSPVAYAAAIFFFLRNLAGDFRDIEKDASEGVKTIPIIFGFRKNWKHVHMIAVICTSFVWWLMSPIQAVWLALVVAIEIWTYDLTAR